MKHFLKQLENNITYTLLKESIKEYGINIG
jgi:hypothetical protein